MHHSYFVLGLTLPGDDRDAARGDRGGGMVLGREDVARAPAHRGTQLHQCLDQHLRLDRHVQTADDTRARERPRRAELLAQGHQPRHLGLGDRDLAPSPIGERNVGGR